MIFGNENIRNICISIRYPFVIIFIAAMFKPGFPMELDKFDTSVCFVAAAVLPFVGVHVGEIISKTIINNFLYIMGALLGYGLCKLRENEIRKVFLQVVLFIMIALGIYGRSLIKKVKDGYDYAPIAFLMAVFVMLQYPSGPDVWLTEFNRNIKTLGLAGGLTILLAFLPPFFAGDEVHNEAQENIHILADIFGDLKEKCFGLPQDLQNKLLSVINSKEKENSLGKFVCWEPRWHPQEQYEKIGDRIRLCAYYTLSLLTYLDRVQFSPDLQEKCKEIWSALAEAYASLYESMKHKTAPAAWINDQDLINQPKLTLPRDNTLQLTAPVLKLGSPENKVENAVRNLASHPDNTVELNQKVIHITSHSFEKLVSSTKELHSNVSELLTGGESPQQFIPGIQEVTTRANQILVAPMKGMVSGLFANLKKLIIKDSSVSDGPDTTQPHDYEPQRGNDKLDEVSIDIQ